MIAGAAYAACGWGRRFHGLTPTAKCGRRIRGLSRIPGWRPGDDYLSIHPPAVSMGQGRAAKPRLKQVNQVPFPKDPP